MGTANGPSNTLDFSHHCSSDGVKINRGSAIKDIKNLGKRLAECFGHFAFFRGERGSGFEFGCEIGGSLEKRNRWFYAIKNLAVFGCRESKAREILGLEFGKEVEVMGKM